MATISDETQATINRVEPDLPEFVPEKGFQLKAVETAPDGPANAKGKGGRPRGPNYDANARKHRKTPEGGTPAQSTSRSAPAPVVEEPPKTLVRGSRWLLRNMVVMMETGYEWEKPEDYEEWLAEAAPLLAAVVQKHFPDWMDRWGDEILLLAMMLVWVTPNVSKKLRERKEQADRNARPQGERKNDGAVPLAKSA